MKTKIKHPEGIYAVKNSKGDTVKVFSELGGLTEARKLVSKHRRWYITPMPGDYQNSEQFVYSV